MTNPTDPRVEAAARAMCLSRVEYDDLVWNGMSEKDKGFYRETADIMLKAADAAAWRPIESAPKNEKVLLGWYNPDGKWCMSFDMAVYDWKCGDYASGEGKHSKATHWQTFPVGP